jgi:hypothetical protein
LSAPSHPVITATMFWARLFLLPQHATRRELFIMKTTVWLTHSHHSWLTHGTIYKEVTIVAITIIIIVCPRISVCVTAMCKRSLHTLLRIVYLQTNKCSFISKFNHTTLFFSNIFRPVSVLTSSGCLVTSLQPIHRSCTKRYDKTTCLWQTIQCDWTYCIYRWAFGGLSGQAVAQWLRHCATNRKVAGSIPDGVTGFFSLT